MKPDEIKAYLKWLKETNSTNLGFNPELVEKFRNSIKPKEIKIPGGQEKTRK